MTENGKDQILRTEQTIADLMSAIRTHKNGVQHAEWAAAALEAANETLAESHAAVQSGLADMRTFTPQLTSTATHLQELHDAIAITLGEVSHVSASIARVSDDVIERIGDLETQARKNHETSIVCLETANRASSNQAASLERVERSAAELVSSMQIASKGFVTAASQSTQRMSDVANAFSKDASATTGLLGSAANNAVATLSNESHRAVEMMRSSAQDVTAAVETLSGEVLRLTDWTRHQQRMQRLLISMIVLLALLVLPSVLRL